MVRVAVQQGRATRCRAVFGAVGQVPGASPAVQVDMECVPVVYALNGAVCHIAVTLVPSDDQAYCVDKNCVEGLRDDDCATPHGTCTVLDKGNSPPASASAAATEVTGRGQCPYIFPRRKAGARRAGAAPASPRGPANPVVISLELLNALSGMPLHHAADRIGVSATALKKVAAPVLLSCVRACPCKSVDFGLCSLSYF